MKGTTSIIQSHMCKDDVRFSFMLITCENSVKLGIKGLFNLLSLISGDLENYFKNLIKNRKNSNQKLSESLLTFSLSI